MGRRRGKDSRVRHKQSTKQEILIKADKKKKMTFQCGLCLFLRGMKELETVITLNLFLKNAV